MGRSWWFATAKDGLPVVKISAELPQIDCGVCSMGIGHADQEAINHLFDSVDLGFAEKAVDGIIENYTSSEVEKH